MEKEVEYRNKSIVQIFIMDNMMNFFVFIYILDFVDGKVCYIFKNTFN